MFSSLGGERFVRVEHTEALVTVPVRRDLLPGEGGNLLFCWLLTSMRAQSQSPCSDWDVWDKDVGVTPWPHVRVLSWKYILSEKVSYPTSFLLMHPYYQNQEAEQGRM